MRLFFIFAFCLALLGCGLMDQFREPASFSKLREGNKDPLHVFSCGPEALEKAFRELKIYIDQEDISHAIQKNHKFNTCVRDILAIFDNRARKITFPEEMFNALKDQGYSVKKIREYSMLNENIDVAIILIKQKNTLNYHWVCFPADENILSFFGENTILKEIYLIVK
tara:strand:+ start:604 stop:1107 length:504 start_codon:yes stop_codon:yes gene_type:complete